MGILKTKEVIILAGGVGSRLGDVTDKIPKPLVTVGGKPMICHIMDAWMLAGVERFVIAGGYKIEALLSSSELYKYPVIVVHTGDKTQTSERVRKCLPYIDGDVFGLSYGDGITTFPLKSLWEYHIERNRTATMLVTHPLSRFGEVNFDEVTGTVTGFSEKPIEDKWVNAGFFVLSKSVSPYLDKVKSLEESTFPELAKHEMLGAVPCTGFWRCMDTPKEVRELNEIWEGNNQSWPT